MKKSAVLIASILAVGTDFAAGLVALPISLQGADAETPCNIFPADIEADEISNNCDFYGNTEIDASNSGLIGIPIGGGGANPCEVNSLDTEAEEVENNCDFYGNTKIDASSELPERPPPPILIPIPERPLAVPLDDDDDDD